MPKRSAQDKINYYHAKLKKLEHEQSKKKRRRVIVYSSSESEENMENGRQYTDAISPRHSKSRSPTPPPLLPVSDETELMECAPSLLPEHLEDAALPGNEIVKESEDDLDSELLAALGDASEETPAYGPEIHSKLAQRWMPILKKGLLKDLKDKLLKEYAIPDNCRLLKAPRLNPELSAAIAEIVKNRDKKIQNEQDQLGLGITAINQAMTLLLTQNDKIQAIKILSDGCRILTDLHQRQTEVRTTLVTRGLDRSFLTVIQEQTRDETLFGEDLSEKIKALKAITKQGLHIKKTPISKPTPSTSTQTAVVRSRFQGNLPGPPRYQPPNRGGRATQYRNQYQYRRGPAAPAAAIRLTSSTTDRRAPTQQ